jgi:hypothetical protein
MLQLLFLTALAANSALLIPTPPRAIGIFMDFESTPGRESVGAMEHEVDDLLKSSGVSLAWRLTKDNRGDQPFAGLVILKFKGTCRSEGTYPASNPFGSIGSVETLGSTKVNHGHVLPYTEVECDQVRKALAYLAPGTGQHERQLALGVAMGRVVAHELYHILGSTTVHAGKGIAQATHSLQDLVSPRRMSFTAENLLLISAK